MDPVDPTGVFVAVVWAYLLFWGVLPSGIAWSGIFLSGCERWWFVGTWRMLSCVEQDQMAEPMP